MKIVATSDLHGTLPDPRQFDDVDVFIIAGDVCPDFSNLRASPQIDWLDKCFRAWLEDLAVPHILGIAGNHDFAFEKFPAAAADLYLPWRYLQDSGAVIDGIKFWGTPWVPNLSLWAFHHTPVVAQARYESIPDDVDILISHGPPFKYCDRTVPRFGDVNAGCPELESELWRIRPEHVICGHIHEGYGRAYHNASGAQIWNVAHNTENYNPINPPVEII